MTKREHVNAQDFVAHTNNGKKGRVVRLDDEPSHVRALVHWTDGSESWADLNTLRKLAKSDKR